MKARIEQAARTVGYRPNVIARSLITGRSNTIGLVAAYLQNYFYPQIVEQLAVKLRERGYHLALFTTEMSSQADPVIDEILGYRMDGLILASTTLSSELASQCRAVGIPVLLFNRTTDNATVSSVTGQNVQGGRIIGQFLAAGGHLRPAYIAGAEDSSTSRDREAGFIAGLADGSTRLHARAVGHYSYDGAAAATRALLASPAPPDAIFCANDFMAFAALDVARHEFGLHIARDISIVGFDNTATAAWPSLSLTSFSQPVDAMVDRTMLVLMDLLDHRDQPARHEVVGGDLVIRGSTRIPAGCFSMNGVLTWRFPAKTDQSAEPGRSCAPPVGTRVGAPTAHAPGIRSESGATSSNTG
jgi:DNA-binding LacI/PurR family transcriptional regulator